MSAVQLVLTDVGSGRCATVAAAAHDRVGRYVQVCVRPAGHDGDHQYRWEPAGWTPPAVTVPVAGEWL
jgi:hypothetical protein